MDFFQHVSDVLHPTLLSFHMLLCLTLSMVTLVKALCGLVFYSSHTVMHIQDILKPNCSHNVQYWFRPVPHSPERVTKRSLSIQMCSSFTALLYL